MYKITETTALKCNSKTQNYNKNGQKIPEHTLCLKLQEHKSQEFTNH